MKQLGTGILTFCGDNNNAYPPACYASGPASDSTVQISWDSLIYSYIGGASGESPTLLAYGVYANDAVAAQALGLAPGLKIMACPFDNLPKVSWMTAANNPQALNVAGRDYSMVTSGITQSGTYPLFQIDPNPKGLPSPTTPGFMGVGMYWLAGPRDPPVNWNPLGYSETVVRHPSGTLMLVELASSQGSEGNVWPSCCFGPVGPGDLYQIDPNVSMTGTPTTGISQGKQLYQAQQYRFNYVFHDGHVELLRYQQTTNGAAAPLTPGGMWSINTAD